MLSIPVQFLSYNTQKFHRKGMEDLDNRPRLITLTLQKHLPGSLILSKQINQ